MKKLSKITLALASTISCLSVAYAGVPNNDKPTTFLGPTLKGGYTSTMSDTTAYSLKGEAGLKNLRVGGTLGWKLDENQYFKLSADYLWQKITYAFFSGDTDEWVTQGSIGADYLYEVGGNYNPNFNLSGYLSHAPSQNLGTVNGLFHTSNLIQSYSNIRRIAGSNAAGLAPGVSLEPWEGGRAGLDLNYDNVRYSTNNGANKDAKGIGGTLTLKQALTQDVGLNLAAAVRQPFTNYSAGLTYANYGNWVFGLDGDYTSGKNTLPNTYNVSLSANYSIDQRCHAAPRPNLKGEYKDYKDMPVAVKDHLVQFTDTPAVYLPQVLAVTDERVEIPNPACAPTPSVIGVIAPQSVIAGDPPITVVTAGDFAPASGLTYSVSATGLQAGDSIVIDAATGDLTLSSAAGSDHDFTFTVTAANSCGAAAISAPTTVTVRVPA